MADLDDDTYGTKDEKIVREAKKRFKRCEEFEGEFRQRFLEDLKFANGDPDNRWQWPAALYSQRVSEQRPCLTVNRTRQHNLQIINDAKQNKPGIIIRPNGGDASYEAAQIYEGVIRHIEYISGAEQVYDTATQFQVQGGIGYWRVVTDYAEDNSFDQEIFIRRVKDPLMVYMDPDMNEVDGSDARFAFVFEDVPRDEFENDYGDDLEDGAGSALNSSDAWSTKDHIRVAEYFRQIKTKDQLLMFTDQQSGAQTFARKSKIPAEIYRAVKKAPGTTIREITEYSVEWYKIAGDKIIDRSIWPGLTIPIVRVVGEETIIEGRLDRKGHTRAMKDAQRMYNYWTSSATEHVALQTKTPFITAINAIEGFEELYAASNRQNLAYLPYRAFDDDGRPLPKPERIQPPQMAQAYTQGMQIAAQEMMMGSGQFQSQMGENENAKSGVAINARQRQGDNATYHFVDGLAIAIRRTGKIIIELVPKIYDTPRIIHIVGDDGKKSQVQVNPNAPSSYSENAQPDSETVNAIFNPNVGKYDVQADIGPSYATRRQEAWNAFTQIASQNHELMPIIGDLMFKNADFPGADAIAQRLERMVPAQAKGDNVPNPQVVQLTEQLKRAQGALQETVQKLVEAEQSAELAEHKADMAKATGSHDSELDAAKMSLDRERLALDRDKLALERDKADAEVKIKEIELSIEMGRHNREMIAPHASSEECGEETESQEPGEPQEAKPDPLLESVNQLREAIQLMSRPRRVIRDENGDIVGLDLL